MEDSGLSILAGSYPDNSSSDDDDLSPPSPQANVQVGVVLHGQPFHFALTATPSTDPTPANNGTGVNIATSAIDLSSSMSSHFPVIQEICKQISEAGGYKLMVITFGSQVDIRSFESLGEHVGSLRFTNYRIALEKILLGIQTRNQMELPTISIFFSDGVPNEGGDYTHVLRNIHAEIKKNPKSGLFCVYLTDYHSDGYPPKCLYDIALAPQDPHLRFLYGQRSNGDPISVITTTPQSLPDVLMSLVFLNADSNDTEVSPSGTATRKVGDIEYSTELRAGNPTQSSGPPVPRDWIQHLIAGLSPKIIGGMYKKNRKMAIDYVDAMLTAYNAVRTDDPESREAELIKAIEDGITVFRQGGSQFNGLLGSNVDSFLVLVNQAVLLLAGYGAGTGKTARLQRRLAKLTDGPVVENTKKFTESLAWLLRQLPDGFQFSWVFLLNRSRAQGPVDFESLTDPTSPASFALTSGRLVTGRGSNHSGYGSKIPVCGADNVCFPLLDPTDETQRKILHKLAYLNSAALMVGMFVKLNGVRIPDCLAFALCILVLQDDLDAADAVARMVYAYLAETIMCGHSLLTHLENFLTVSDFRALETTRSVQGVQTTATNFDEYGVVPGADFIKDPMFLTGYFIAASRHGPDNIRRLCDAKKTFVATIVNFFNMRSADDPKYFPVTTGPTDLRAPAPDFIPDFDLDRAVSLFSINPDDLSQTRGLLKSLITIDLSGVNPKPLETALISQASACIESRSTDGVEVLSASPGNIVPASTAPTAASSGLLKPPPFFTPDQVSKILNITGYPGALKGLLAGSDRTKICADLHTMFTHSTKQIEAIRDRESRLLQAYLKNTLALFDSPLDRGVVDLIFSRLSSLRSLGLVLAIVDIAKKASKISDASLRYEKLKLLYTWLPATEKTITSRSSQVFMDLGLSQADITTMSVPYSGSIPGRSAFNRWALDRANLKDKDGDNIEYVFVGPPGSTPPYDWLTKIDTTPTLEYLIGYFGEMVFINTDHGYKLTSFHWNGRRVQRVRLPEDCDGYTDFEYRYVNEDYDKSFQGSGSPIDDIHQALFKKQ